MTSCEATATPYLPPRARALRELARGFLRRPFRTVLGDSDEAVDALLAEASLQAFDEFGDARGGLPRTAAGTAASSGEQRSRMAGKRLRIVGAQAQRLDGCRQLQSRQAFVEHASDARRIACRFREGERQRQGRRCGAAAFAA